MYLGRDRVRAFRVLPRSLPEPRQEGGEMTFYTLLFFAGALVIVVVFGLLRSLGAYRKFRGNRIISCPENHRPAAVRVAAAKAAIQAATGTPHLQLSECSRWPEMAGCGQECLAQIQEAPKACLVSNIVNRWYQGRSCAYCHKPFDEIQWHDHPPAVVDQQGETIEWTAIPLDHLQQTLSTHWPVCWNCHIAETFRRRHPELVTNRRTH